jgi:hypothetical protein
MFIKSIVIDGFKSYGRRTEITGFNPEFNAITGKYEIPLFVCESFLLMLGYLHENMRIYSKREFMV